MKPLFVRRRHLLALAAAAVAVAAAALLWGREGPEVWFSAARPAGERVVHMVTGEFSATLEDGRKIEAYRWDPGTVVVKKGELVKLVIRGVNGAQHPFVIEGLNVRGVVTKGRETTVTFRAAREGIYRLICTAHPDAAHNGPMIAYIVVE